MANATDDRLRLLIERVERLEEEKKGIADDIRDVYAEAKAVGYDAKIMRQIVRLRKMKPDDRQEQIEESVFKIESDDPPASGAGFEKPRGDRLGDSLASPTLSMRLHEESFQEIK